MLAHELRNPLAAITTAVGILDRRAQVDPKDARMVSIIQRQTNHLARLVDDLLDVSRLTRGKVELRQAQVDLRGVLEQVLAVFRPQAAGPAVDARVERAGRCRCGWRRTRRGWCRCSPTCWTTR